MNVFVIFRILPIQDTTRDIIPLSPNVQGAPNNPGGVVWETPEEFHIGSPELSPRRGDYSGSWPKPPIALRRSATHKISLGKNIFWIIFNLVFIQEGHKFIFK